VRAMTGESLARKSARELARLIATRAASPLEVLDAHLAVIARVDPGLNAVVTLAAEQARTQARAAEAAVLRGETLGPLGGLPVAIKDVTPTAGIRTTFGSPLDRDHVPGEDAAAEQQRQEVFHRFRQLFERYDVLLTPAAPVKPYPVELNFPQEINGRKLESYVDWIAPAFLITLVSLPAGSVPAGLTRDGLPVGLQVVAPRFEEPRILSVAKLVQRAHAIGWPPQA